MSMISAIVLSAGKGKRMGNDRPKQYMDLWGKPVICHTLSAFESSHVDEVILVTAEDDIEICQKDLVLKYGFRKVKKIVAGGEARYDSVYEGLKAAEGEYVLIHDGARCLITADVIDDAIKWVKKYDACVVGMPSKDTVKIADQDSYVESTPKRDNVWIIQTPQCFKKDLIRKAFDRMYEKKDFSGITDDAMVAERFMDTKVKLVEGSYDNIKITTPEDLITAEMIIKHRKES
ncbi:MAG: 2-C-methyl-D-erythritol 4-phosphate cytidylyltransferase [Lachnospiraceae bacterium]|nr:2-C-methyl-D-erythritol 4-phosphate cytidylyltransferase [Lachnospiraceae bacterium]